MRARIAALAVALSAAFTSTPAPAAVAPSGEAQMVGVVEHVANLPYSGGSDVELGTEQVVKLSNGATGDPVCRTDASGGCLVDEDGGVIYETQLRDFAFAGRLGANAWVIDVTDPRAPVKVAELPCSMTQNDIQLWGSLVLQAADNTSGRCTYPDGTVSLSTVGISDISDPRNPVLLGTFRESRGAHNVTVHPTQPLAYVSNSDQTGDGRVHIWDFTNPAAPVKVQDWVYLPVESPHDITFSADGSRAYLAARTLTHIVNTEDPRAPVVISSVPHHGYLSHQSDPTPDGNYLLVAEELLGGGFDTPSPGGPVWVWDIRDEAHPVEIGAIANDETGLNGVSTAHVFRINPDGYTMAIAWYSDGFAVVDYSSIAGANAAGLGTQAGAGPRVVASARMPGADAWSAKMWQERHPGYVFVNDISRGFDVFYVAELGADFVAQATIHAGHRGSYAADTGVTRNEFVAECTTDLDNQGVDGWALEVPGGARSMSALGTSRSAYDLDFYFFDAQCGLVAEDEDAGTNETAEVPPEAEYALVTSYAEGGLVRVRITAS